MAIEQTVKLNSGIEIKQCYVRVENVTVSEKENLSIVVNFYFNKDKTPVKQESYSAKYDLLGDNPIKQSYLHLKTLPEFAGAKDC